MDLSAFAKTASIAKKQESEKVALLAFYFLSTEGVRSFSVRDVGVWFEALHLSAPNTTRLVKSLRSSNSFRTQGAKRFALHATKIDELDAIWAAALQERGKVNGREFKVGLTHYVAPERLEELRKTPGKDYDFSKLIRLCEEICACAESKSYFSVALLVRTIIDHVPPAFGMKNFSEVANNYSGTRSFRDSMRRLDESSRKIADQHLHTPLRKSESLPNLTQVDFSNDLDLLIAEIVRISK